MQGRLVLLDGGKSGCKAWILRCFLVSSDPMASRAFLSLNDDLSAFGSSTTFGQRFYHSGVSAGLIVVDDVTSQLPYFYFV